MWRPTVSNPDFDGLRAEVEAGTRVPDFDKVQRRARRIRLRDRVTMAVAVLAALAVVAPLGVSVWRLWPGHRVAEVVGPDRPALDPTEPAPAPTPTPTRSQSRPDPVAKIQALAGIDLDHLYAAVDVCSGSTCSLQISLVPLNAANQRPPVVVGQLRDTATAALGGVRLTPLGPRSLLLSGEAGGGQRRYTRVSVPRTVTEFAGGASQPAAPQGGVRALGQGDRAVQLTENGEVYGARATDDELTRVAAQPGLVAPAVATGVTPANGWWVTGSDPDTDELAVAVSRDQGHTWTARALGVASAVHGVPAVATFDGRTGYVFVGVDSPSAAPDDGAVVGWRTADGGLTWQRIATRVPASPEVGVSGKPRLSAVVRRDGSILLWSGEGDTPAYLESTDDGQTFHRTSGLPGRIVALSDGFAAVSLPPAVSRDGRSWTPVLSPAYLPPA
jgi:hypothetical protein